MYTCQVYTRSFHQTSLPGIYFSKGEHAGGPSLEVFIISPHLRSQGTDVTVPWIGVGLLH